MKRFLNFYLMLINNFLPADVLIMNQGASFFIKSRFNMESCTAKLFTHRHLSILIKMKFRLFVCVCVCVCLSQPFIWTLWDRFRWNLDHMILTKIWDDTFLKFWKCCLNDVITAFLMFYDEALSHLQFLCNFLPIDICCSSSHGFVWDCNPAFSVHIFYPKWRLEKQLKIKKNESDVKFTKNM